MRRCLLPHGRRDGGIHPDPLGARFGGLEFVAELSDGAGDPEVHAAPGERIAQVDQHGRGGHVDHG